MVEIEVLFSSGQGVVLPVRDREAALQFMQRAIEVDPEKVGLTHVSTEYEEVLIDLADISFVRLKKENYPRLQEGHQTLRLAAKSVHSRSEKYRHADPQQPIEMQGHTQAQEEPIQMPSGEHKEKASESDTEPSESKQKSESKKDKGKTQAQTQEPPKDPLQEHLDRAKVQFDKAEERLDQIEYQREKVETKLTKQRESIEDEIKEEKLRKEIEDIELSNEIKDMKKG